MYLNYFLNAIKIKGKDAFFMALCVISILGMVKLLALNFHCILCKSDKKQSHIKNKRRVMQHHTPFVF
jgi:hypothetical protein